ncbi:hypothetical protein ACFW1A_27905 [Kitasatospora sp. NPDC058965]|uniref:hypothetical protein n=1 Tax=Kitasatospora sp. NPDC058965 TaxID=3346682 RepID=UPI0036923CCD
MNDLVNGDSTGAAADLADALQGFADLAAGPGARAEVRVTVGTPHDLRTVQLPANLADWITELVREETRALKDVPDADGPYDG